VDSNRTAAGVPSNFHANCEVFISQGSSRCKYCKKHHKSLCALASRHNNSTQAVDDNRNDTSVSDKLINDCDNTKKEQHPSLANEDLTVQTITDLQNGLKRHEGISSGMEKCNNIM